MKCGRITMPIDDMRCAESSAQLALVPPGLGAETASKGGQSWQH